MQNCLLPVSQNYSCDLLQLKYVAAIVAGEFSKLLLVSFRKWLHYLKALQKNASPFTSAESWLDYGNMSLKNYFPCSGLTTWPASCMQCSPIGSYGRSGRTILSILGNSKSPTCAHSPWLLGGGPIVLIKSLVYTSTKFHIWFSRRGISIYSSLCSPL